MHNIHPLNNLSRVLMFSGGTWSLRSSNVPDLKQLGFVTLPNGTIWITGGQGSLGSLEDSTYILEKEGLWHPSADLPYPSMG